MKGNFLHLYEQNDGPHSSAFIIGDIEALTNLRNSINKAIEDSVDHMSTFSGDGEEYDIYTVRVDHDDQSMWPASKEFRELRVPADKTTIPLRRPYNLFWSKYMALQEEGGKQNNKQ